jgi:hypothetical protein
MIGVQFDKARAEYFLDCIRRGKPIARPPGAQGWTCYDMMALAGAMYSATMSHGPGLYQDVDWPKMPFARREATEDDFMADLHGAIDWYAQATMLVADAEYDERFEPQHRAILRLKNGKKAVLPLSGFKDTGSEDDEDE